MATLTFDTYAFIRKLTESGIPEEQARAQVDHYGNYLLHNNPNLSASLIRNPPMQAIKQYTEVIDGSIHINLPSNFTAKRVELIILSADDNDADMGDFQRFLLNSPEMTDEEYQAIEEKRGHLNQWT
jgi:hypothetical protein